MQIIEQKIWKYQIFFVSLHEIWVKGLFALAET